MLDWISLGASLLLGTLAALALLLSVASLLVVGRAAF